MTNGGPGTRWPQTSVVDLSSYNPSLVYIASSAWTSLEQNNTAAYLIAQIGWLHDTTSNNEFVFAQWTDNNGHFSSIHSFYTTPSGTNNYAVYRQGNGTYDLEWTGGYTLLPSNVNWGPDTVANMGEVDGYHNGNGDHFPGNNTTPVVFSNANWTDQYSTNHIASLTYYAANGSYNGGNAPSYGYLYNWSGSKFEIWDSRCS